MLSMLEGFRKPKKKPKKRVPSFRVYREPSVAPPPIHHYSNSFHKQLQSQQTVNNYNKRSAAARALRELHIRARKARALSRPSGILSLGKSKSGSKRKKKCVRFTKEEMEVIGYGGIDVVTDSDDDDDFEFETSEQPAPLEREVAGEEEKALEKLTRTNTDYNSSLKNLNGTGTSPSKSTASTSNNKQQKHTVQVSIQPFSSPSIAASRKTHLNRLLEDDSKPVVNESSTKEDVKKSPAKLDSESKPVRNEVKCMGKEVLVRGLTETEELCLPNIKTIVIEPKRDERGLPEGRKSHIQRGSIVTKAHEQVKNKLIVQKNEKRGAVDGENDEDVKTIIISVEDKNIIEANKKSDCPDVNIEKPRSEEVTVKVLKLLNGQNCPPESREMAGEPDGKADSDEHEQEPPISPPPRSSFLHRTDACSSSEKPPKPLPGFAEMRELKCKPPPPPPYQPEIKPPPRPTSLLGLTKTASPEIIAQDVNASLDIRTSPRSKKGTEIQAMGCEINKMANPNVQLNAYTSSDEKKSGITNRLSPMEIKKPEIATTEVKRSCTPTKAKIWAPPELTYIRSQSDPKNSWTPPEVKIAQNPGVKNTSALHDQNAQTANAFESQRMSSEPETSRITTESKPTWSSPEVKSSRSPVEPKIRTIESKTAANPLETKQPMSTADHGRIPDVPELNLAKTDVMIESSTYEPVNGVVDCKNDEAGEFYDEIDLSANELKNNTDVSYPVDHKSENKMSTEVIEELSSNTASKPTKVPTPEVSESFEKPKMSIFDSKSKVSSTFSASCPDVKNAKNGSLETTKTFRASSVFSSISSEFRSFKSFLSSPGEGKKSGLPPTPLTLARASPPPPALPLTPSPASSSSLGQSPTSECSLLMPLSTPSSSLVTSSPPSSLESSQPSSKSSSPSMVLPNHSSPGSTPTVSYRTLPPLLINTTPLEPPLTPSDDVPVLQEVYARKRPAPKPPIEPIPPEPIPRRRNSGETALGSSGHGTEKKKTRVRQTLRRLLRFGSREEENHHVPPVVPLKGVQDDPPPAVPRPRPHIIHPLDLNKSAVQVLPASGEKSSPDSSTCSSSSIYANSSIASSVVSPSVPNRPLKPPPPPRSESLNLMERLRPRDSPNSADNVYVNLGEGRCGIAPVKPQRTGSLRGESSTLQKTSQAKTTLTFQDSDHVYEAVGISSAPEKPPKKQHHQPTLSETADDSVYEDTEIYYPYVTFQNGECKTIMKKRGIITKSLEENYSAVVIANLEALAHLMKQLLEKRAEVPPALQSRAFLSWNSFEITESPKVLNGISLVDGTIGNQDVSLVMVPNDTNKLLPTDLPYVWARFNGVVPMTLSSDETNGNHSCEVFVLKRTSAESFTSFVQNLEKTVEGVREGVFILLQIIKCLATRQSSSPRASLNENDFLVFTCHGSGPAGRIRTAVYLPRPVQAGDDQEDASSYEEVAQSLSKNLLSNLALGRVLTCNCRTLADMANVLSVWLWGPASPLPPQATKRWLDLERANLLQSMIRATPSESLDLDNLAFLVETSAAHICRAHEIIHS